MIRYNGRPTPPPDYFPPEMEEACEYIERIVNTEMRKRERYPLEWGGGPNQEGEAMTDEPIIWQPNVAASNRYEGGSESVGFCSDQLTYLGPYPTIASLSLGQSMFYALLTYMLQLLFCSQVQRECLDCVKSYRRMRRTSAAREHTTFPFPIIQCVPCSCLGRIMRYSHSVSSSLSCMHLVRNGSNTPFLHRQ